MRIAICDDVAADRRSILNALRSYLGKHAMEAEIEEFSRPDRLLSAARHKAFDLYLLDVLLDDGVTGIDVVRRLRDVHAKVPVIFFSTSREYAVDAFAVEAVSYLQKPWTKESFSRVMDLATEKYRKSQAEMLAFRGTNGVVRFLASQIEFVATAETVNYIAISRVGGPEVIIRGSVRNFAEQYGSLVHLVSAGRSLLINPAQVSSLESDRVRFFSGRFLFVPKSVLPTLAKEVLALSRP